MYVIRLSCGALLLLELSPRLLLTPKKVMICIHFRNLSEPVMTYKLHKELVSAASKYLSY